MMNVKEVLEFVDGFANGMSAKIGNGFTVRTTPLPSLDISRFPDEIQEDHLEGDWRKGGVYIFHTEEGRVLYLGKANSIEARVYKHLGAGFSWARNGKECKFPNFELTKWDGRKDIESLRDICTNGNFRVTGVVVEPIEAAKLIESAAIFWCFAKGEPTPLNIDF